MPKKAVDYVIQRQEQFEQDIQKRNLPDYQKKGWLLSLFFQYIHMYTLHLFILSLFHEVVCQKVLVLLLNNMMTADKVQSTQKL